MMPTMAVTIATTKAIVLIAHQALLAENNIQVAKVAHNAKAQ